MDERRIQYLVGVMVLATLIIAGILVVLFNDLPALIHGEYTVRVRATEAPGVSRNTPVRKSGILIGRVSDVELGEKGNVIITARINAKYQIRENDICQISGGLLGDAELRFVRLADQGLPTDPIEPGATIEGRVAADPVRVITDMQKGLSSAINEVSMTSTELRKVVSQVGDLIAANEKRISNIIEQTDDMLAVTQEAVTNANDLIADPELRQRLRDTAAETPQLLAEARATMAQARETVASMNQTLVAVDRNLQNVENFTRPLGEHGEELVQKIDGSVRDLELIMGELAQFSRSINNRQGSLGRLVHDRELYDNLNGAAANIEELSRQLRPILNDARVFTDKIARHPERLGVRGAMQKHIGIK
jgi:phospholipid/cholesterol/gamma-HCH transport system substrate-binding protein